MLLELYTRYLHMYVYIMHTIGVKDYNGRIRTVTIPAGVSSRSFSIPVVNDNTVECTEIFNIRMQTISVQGVSIGSVNNIRASIIDNDSKCTYVNAFSILYIFIVHNTYLLYANSL